MRSDVAEMADTVEALQDEIEVLSKMDPYDPQIPMMQERLQHTLKEMYNMAPRGV